MKALLFLTLSLSMLAGCQETPKNFLGRSGTIVMRAPTKIEAWRIHGGPSQADTNSTPKQLDVALAKQLGDIMLDPDTYDFNSAKPGCEFQPLAGFRVWHDKRSVDVILCFHCNELKLISPDPVSKRYPSRVQGFDKARPAMVRLAKQAFPDDREIQDLK
jgi:hypothetical protein